MTEVTESTFVVRDTTDLQTESLVRFAEGMGYDAVFDNEGRLRSFRAPRFDKYGSGKVSVATMIRAHNDGPDDALAELATLAPKLDYFFFDLVQIKGNHGHRLMTMLFSGSLKLVDRVHGQGTRRNGLVIQRHQVKFMHKDIYLAVKPLLDLA